MGLDQQCSSVISMKIPRSRKRENSTPQPSSSSSTQWIALDSYPRQLDKEKLFSVQGSTRETLRISPEITHFFASLTIKPRIGQSASHPFVCCKFYAFSTCCAQRTFGSSFLLLFFDIKKFTWTHVLGVLSKYNFLIPFSALSPKKGLGPFYRWDLRSCGIIFA